MPKCPETRIDFGRFGRRMIEADCSSGGEPLLLRQLGQHYRLGLVRLVAIPGPTNPVRFTHSLRDLLAQRLNGLSYRCEDLNDHQRPERADLRCPKHQSRRFMPKQSLGPDDQHPKLIQ